MKVEIIVRPSGLLNGQPWPEVGETIDLPKVVADDMIRVGHAKAVGGAKPAPKESRPRHTKAETRKS